MSVNNTMSYCSACMYAHFPPPKAFSEHIVPWLCYDELSPLWDGAGGGPANTCYSLNNHPWFLKQMLSTTTDDIEMRMCRDQQ